jgi:sulfate adenylyltransferase subunit 1 (EFTu-like GTPase family)
MAKRGYRTITLELPKTKTTVPIRASPLIGDALDEISAEMSLYHGVRLLQVLEAVYTQGTKDGARTAFAAIDASTATAKAAVPHRSVGRPTLRRKSTTK